MNEMANGVMGFASMGFSAALVIVGLIAWFFVNRASVRASEQIRLLESLLDEQKKQNALLRRLMDSVSGSESKNAVEQQDEKDFTRLIPER